MSVEASNPYAAELVRLHDLCQEALTADAWRELVQVDVGFDMSIERAVASDARLYEDGTGGSARPDPGTPEANQLIDAAVYASEQHVQQIAHRQVMEMGGRALPAYLAASVMATVDRSAARALTHDEDGGNLGVNEVYLTRDAEPDSTQVTIGVNTLSDGYYHANFTVGADRSVSYVVFGVMTPEAVACLDECEAVFGINSMAGALLEGHVDLEAIDATIQLVRESARGIYPDDRIDELLGRLRNEAIAARQANSEHNGVTPERLARITQFVLSM